MPAAQPLPQPASPPFVVTRTFNAPRALVWQAFTEGDRLKAWWGPKGFPVASGQIDLRPGGSYHYAMQVPDGSLMWAKCAYREIAAPERFTFINCFCNESGAIERNPMVPGWPMEVLSVFRFTEQGGRTMFTLEWTPLGATSEECELFDSFREGMAIGWEGTFEQLDAYLSGVRAEAGVLAAVG
jgi:uncharacterized protein YndB with AHSA1/START domain